MKVIFALPPRRKGGSSKVLASVEWMGTFVPGIGDAISIPEAKEDHRVIDRQVKVHVDGSKFRGFTEHVVLVLGKKDD